MSEEFKKYTIQDLVEAFKEAGFPVSKSWIMRQEDKGNLKLPRSTTNFKKVAGTRRVGAVRYFTKSQIDSVVRAFLPGGSGYFNFEKENI